MKKAAIRGLLGRKVRTSLTGLAVVLGVAMVSGTLVLTDTISRAFDAVFSNSYKGTSAVITGKELVKDSASGTATVPASPLPRVKRLSGVQRGGRRDLRRPWSVRLRQADRPARQGDLEQAETDGRAAASLTASAACGSSPRRRCRPPARRLAGCSRPRTDTASTRPSCSVMRDGYQRPPAMSGSAVHAPAVPVGLSASTNQGAGIAVADVDGDGTPGGSSIIKTTTSAKPSPLMSATARPAPAFSYGNQSGTAVKSVFIG